MPTLLIHPRKGLFRLTICQNCGHTWSCQNCTSNLTTYRTNDKQLELICNHCQTAYNYPNDCPQCHSKQVFSKFGGMDELEEVIQKEFGKNIIRLDNLKTFVKINSTIAKNSNADQLFATTRVFDPAIDYAKFSKIIFIQAENLLASSDYLVQEELIKSLTELFLQLDPQTEVIFDKNGQNIDFFEDLQNLSLATDGSALQAWFAQKMELELANRKKYNFPPYSNLLLLTSQEKDYQKSLQKLQATKEYLQKIQSEIPQATWGRVYPARLLRRKGYYSHHILVKFPKNYSHFPVLQKAILGLASLYKLQVRLNPRHTF